MAHVPHDQLVFYRENSHDVERLLWLPPAPTVPPRGSSAKSPATALRQVLLQVIDVLAPCLDASLIKKLVAVLSQKRNVGQVPFSIVPFSLTLGLGPSRHGSTLNIAWNSNVYFKV